MKARPRKKSYDFTDEVTGGGFVRSLVIRRDWVASLDHFPWSLPVLRNLEALELHPKVTFFVGENGSGKSTLLEGLAESIGFAKEGGSKDFNLHFEDSWSDMGRTVRLVRGARREKDTFYLRGESFFNVATRIEELGKGDRAFLQYYGGRSPHEQSHGESFLRLAANRFAGEGLYLLDEPEAALSPGRQLAFLKLIDTLVRLHGSQMVIATHSPIFMAYPDALIYEFSDDGIHLALYEDTEHFRLTRDFLTNRAAYLRELFRDE